MRTLISSLLLASASITSAYAITASQPSIVEMQTNIGTITIQLNWDKAPISAQNFLNYVNSGFYKGTFFHRAVKDFVIQGGGMDAKTMTFKKTLPSILSEAYNGLKNTKGTIAMARVADPNSANSQFYFNLKDNANLDKGAILDDKGTVADGYTVFGETISGMDIVSKIGNYATIKTGYSEGVPFGDVVDCGFNFCLKKVIVEAVYASKVVDTFNSMTRITVNGRGKVTSIPRGINCGDGSKVCTLKKPFGTEVTLKIVPSTDYEFKGWSGDCSGTITPLVLEKTKNKNCTATFEKKIKL